MGRSPKAKSHRRPDSNNQKKRRRGSSSSPSGDDQRYQRRHQEQPREDNKARFKPTAGRIKTQITIERYN
jgi:hypothetical protein